MIKLTQHVIKYPWLYVVLAVVITLFFISQMGKLVVETEITASLPEKLPEKRMYDRMDELFPAKDFVFIGIFGEDLFAPGHLKTIWDFTEKLEGLPGVTDVLSPTNLSIITGTEEGMDVSEIVEKPPVTDEEVQQFQADLFGSDLALGNIVSRDSSMLGIMLLLRPHLDKIEFVSSLIDLVEKENAESDLEFILAGEPVANYYVSLGLQRDMSVFFMGGIGLITLLLLIIFKTLRGIFLPIAVVILSVLWTIGLMGLVGATMSHATEAMPILIMSIAVADTIHILSHYYGKAVREKDKKKLVLLTMNDMNIPVVMTSITTMAGFLALTISSFGEQAKMGVFTAIGVFFAMILSVTFVPALLSWLRVPKILQKRSESALDSRLMTRWGGLLASNRKVLYPLVAILVVVCGFGISQVEHSYSQIESFPPDHPFRIAYERINDHFAGTTSFDIMVEGVDPDVIKDPAILTDLDNLKSQVLKLEHVGDAMSLADLVKRMNKVLNADDEAYYTIPAERVLIHYTDFEEQGSSWVEVSRTDTVSGRELIAQFLSFYEMSGKPEDLANMVDYDYQNARMTIFLNTDDMGTLRHVKERLDTYIDDHFEGTETAVTGMASLLLILDELIVSGQIKSVILALLFIWIITSLMFRSPVIGLYNTLPLLFGLILNFAVMGFVGIRINIETMMISSIIIGVGVDYAIHYIYTYRRSLADKDDYVESILSSMAISGVAIAYNSLVVAAGFAVLMFSGFVSVRNMGAMISLTMLTTAFGALTLLPLLFVNLKPKSLLTRTKIEAK